MSEYEYATDREIKDFFGITPPIRYVGNTAYVQTLSQALAVSDEPNVAFVVIEDNAERIKLNRLTKALKQA